MLGPLPRVTWRTIGYGLDPADDFARRLSALTSNRFGGGSNRLFENQRRLAGHELNASRQTSPSPANHRERMSP